MRKRFSASSAVRSVSLSTTASGSGNKILLATTDDWVESMCDLMVDAKSSCGKGVTAFDGICTLSNTVSFGSSLLNDFRVKFEPDEFDDESLESESLSSDESDDDEDDEDEPE